MVLLQIDYQDIFLKDLDFSLAIEIGIRTIIMFILVLIFLRSTGKKGVRQLSIFEVAIIIALGSAAGDPMFNGEFAIVPSLIVFLSILGTYRLITYLAAKSQTIENLLEGEPMYIIEDGMFTLKEDGDANFAKDEFFAEMRAKNIEHMGQIRTAILESNGQVSFLFYPIDAHKPGLPIYPKAFSERSEKISKEGDYACTHCAKIEHLSVSSTCKRCGKKEWVLAMDTKREN